MSYDAELSNHLSGSTFNLTQIEAWIKAGANPDTVNSKGDNVLHRVIEAKAFHYIPMVLKLGVDVEKPNGKGLTALQCLFKDQPVNVEVASLLISAGARRDTIDNEGNNLVHHAVFSGNLSNIFLAIKLGANAQKLNVSGLSPLACVLEQKPVNLNAFALVLFAASGALLRMNRFAPPPLRQEYIVDCDNQSSYAKEYIDPAALIMIGEHGGNKEKVLKYIKNCPTYIQKELLRQVLDSHQNLDKETPLGQFFAVKRGPFPVHPEAGTWAALIALQKEINRAAPLPSIRIVQSAVAPPPPYAPEYIPSAPPVESLYLASSGYPGMMFAPQPPVNLQGTPADYLKPQ